MHDINSEEREREGRGGGCGGLETCREERRGWLTPKWIKS